MKKRILISVVLVICMALSFVFPVFAQPKDIIGHWAEKEISEFLTDQFIGTYSDGTFKPNQSITRAEFVSLVNKVFDFTKMGRIKFKDVSIKDEYFNDVRRAIEAGYIEGYEDGTFRPKNKLSREEMAVILCRVLKLDLSGDLDALNRFRDRMFIADWSKPSVNAVVRNEYMEGYGNNIFSPKRKTTRAEAVMTLYNIYKEENKEESQEENSEEILSFNISSINLTNGSIQINFDSEVAGLQASDFLVSAKLDNNEYILKDLIFDSENNKFNFTPIESTFWSQFLEVSVSSNSLKVTGAVNAKLEVIGRHIFYGGSVISGYSPSDNTAPSIPVITKAPASTSVSINDDVTITALSTDAENDSIEYIWEGRLAETSKYPVGRHVVKVKAKDEHGLESQPAAIVFYVVDSSGSGGLLLTSAESRIYENGLPGATIVKYNFNVPSVSGHYGDDYSWVKGLNRNTKQWEQIEYQATSNGITLQGDLEPGKYSRLEFFYYASHCMYGKSNITYTVDFAFDSEEEQYDELTPTASDVSIAGSKSVGETLTGSYTYADENGDLEGVSTFAWYRADDENGTNKVVIQGATARTYTLTQDDKDKYIYFEVTPVAVTGVTGTTVGNAVLSQAAGPVTGPVMATLEPTGRVGTNNGKVYQEYELKDGLSVISLKDGDITSITVSKDGETPTSLTPDSDSTLWFNVQKDAGVYEYTVVNANATYKATLNWTVPKVINAEATGNVGEHQGIQYKEYTFKDGAVVIDLDVFDAMFQIKPDGSVSELIANSDKTLWFNVSVGQQDGTHIFLLKKAGVWYKATVEYTAPVVSTGEVSYTDNGDGSATFIITVKNQLGEKVKNLQDSDFAVVLRNQEYIVSQTPTMNFTNNEDGTYTIVFNAGIAINEVVDVKVKGVEIVNDMPVVITVTSEVTTGSMTYTDNANGSGTFVVTVKNQFGDAMSNLTANDFTVVLRDQNYVVSQTPTMNFTSNEDGTYTIVFNAGIAVNEVVDVKVKGVEIASDMPVVITVTSEVTTGSMTYTDNANGSGTFVVTVKNQFGDAMSNLTANDFTVVLRGQSYVVSQTPTMNFTNNEDGTYTIVFNAGIAVNEVVDVKVKGVEIASDMPVVITVGSIVTTGSMTYTDNGNGSGIFVVTVKNQFGDAMSNLTAADFTVILRGQSYVVSQTPTMNFTNNEDGTYTIVFNAGIAVNETVDVKVKGVEIVSDMSVVITVGSIVTTGSMTYTDNGNGSGIFVVTVKNQFGDAMSNLTANDFTVALRGQSYVVSQTPTMNFTNNEDGTYTIVFNAGIAVNEVVDVKVKGVEIVSDMSVVITVPQSDTTAPVITIAPYNTDSTNQDITVNASTNEGTLNAERHTFTENGSFEFVATDAAGNITRQIVTISNIDKLPPVITIAAYNTNITNQDITVTASTNEGTLNAESHTFTENGSFEFIVADAAGNVTRQIVEITNIDKTAPTATITYSTTDSTNQNVIAAIDSSEEVTVTNNEGSLSYTFSQNGNFIFEFVDAAGNTGSATATVNNIDKTAPTATIEYSTTDFTNQNVTATIIPSETVTVTNNNSSLSYIFNQNGNFTFEFVDAAGNIGTATATVNNIDKIAPTKPSMIVSSEWTSGQSIGVVLVDGMDNESGVDRTEYSLEGATNVPWTIYNGLVSITREGQTKVLGRTIDSAGNISPIEVGVAVIDRTSPTITLTPDPITQTNGNVTVTASITDSGSGVSVKKWAYGDRGLLYFAIGGNDLNNTTFTATHNGTYTVYAKDNLGNEGLETITISNIDRVPPVITIGPYNTNPTNQDITVNASTNEGTMNAGSHTFTANDNFEFVATDAAGNVTRRTITITNIDKAAPVITIGSYNTNPTNQDITVNASTNEGTLNAGSHTFTANDSFEFVATDAAGNVTRRTITIINIDKDAPVITIGSYNTNATNQDITVTASTNEGSLNAESHTFTENSSFEFVATDAAGNVTRRTITITNIDKDAPIITIGSYNTNATNQDITVTASTNEGSLNAESHTFTENSSFEFVATDAAGNVTRQTISITNIDKNAPTATVSYNIEELTSDSVVATIVPNEAVTVTNNSGSKSYTFTDNGSFTFEFADAAGNTGTITATVSNIRKLTATDLVLTSVSTEQSRAGTQTKFRIFNRSGLNVAYTYTVVGTEIRGNGTIGKEYTEETRITNPYYFYVNAVHPVTVRINWGSDGQFGTVKASGGQIIDDITPENPVISANTTVLTNQDVTVTIEYSADSTVRQYKLNAGGSWLDYTIPLVLSSNATVYAKAADAAGNATQEVSLEISNIDKIVPQDPIINVNPDASLVTITNIIDNGSGVKRTEYSINGSSTWLPYTVPFPISAEVTTTITARTIDNAGNISQEITRVWTPVQNNVVMFNSFIDSNLDKTKDVVADNLEVVSVTEVTLDNSALTLEVGKSALLTATVVPDVASNKAAAWESSDANVATVDDNGNVTGAAEGIAVITVKTVDGEKTAACTVTVVKPVEIVNPEQNKPVDNEGEPGTLGEPNDDSNLNQNEDEL